MDKIVTSTESAPAPVARYSQAVRKGNIVQVAGQVGLVGNTGEVAGSTVREQTTQIFDNISAILREAGSSIDDVVMMRVYLTDIEHFAEFNATYNELVRTPYPARTTIYVGLPPGFLVEIDALAVLD